ncbi:helix-turn-helix domain-containing protein [Ideonella sp. 4Y11]|uniref:Helix-turn-helix domain-containing protein n=1 Tax=Ideonella aquatica TaxID=2824119 RepID=A0A940YT43_9BURK|nr:helix-turn-helix domain-containing protein [Ideonella aquatica]MBQ0961966.1 helix-turn-helix domain-containing protein [Ideonella aquatica]
MYQGSRRRWGVARSISVTWSTLPRAATPSRRAVDRACELMPGNTAKPMSVLELCHQVGASRRQLNHCFHDALGTSPLKAPRLVRLDGARRELKPGRDRSLTVQDGPPRWGFWLLGQCVLVDKKQCGALPSATPRVEGRDGSHPSKGGC